MGSAATAAGLVFAGSFGGTSLGGLLNLIFGHNQVCPLSSISEVECKVTCERPASDSSWSYIFVICLALVAAWALGFLCGSCCPRAAVKHNIQFKGKGTWGAPAIAY